jgi:hypothetical protein
MLAVSIALVAFDFQNLLAWWRGKVVSLGERSTFDFTIVVPLFGQPRYFDGREAIARYRANVLVALEVTPPHMQAFAAQLEEEGWRVCRIEEPQPDPPRLLKAALPSVTTGHVLRLDADTAVGPGVDRLVAAVAASDADICSVKVEALEPRTIAAKLQALEYRMAMLSRHFRPWLTSGACFVAKTDSLRVILDHHSLWSPGEDIETGRTAHALRMRVRHGDFVVATDVPATWRALGRQRRLWWAGTFRHYVVNADRNLLHLPLLTSYMLLAVFASVHFKVWSMLDWRALPAQLPFLLAIYAFVTFVSNIQVRSWWMIVFPLYALTQSLVMPLLGGLHYTLLAYRRRKLGRYRFGYRRRFPAETETSLRIERISRAAAAVADARR